MTLVTALKDYVEVVHKLIETAPGYINNHTDYTDFITLSTYLCSAVKQGVLSFLSFEWASNIFYLPIIVPQMASAMFSEISVFDGQFHNLYTFLDGPVSEKFLNGVEGIDGAYLKNSNDLSLPISLFEKFLIGVSNSLFFWIPTSAATFLCLRRFAMQGIEAGYSAAFGTLMANLFWLASVLLGLRFIVIPWTSFDLARYWLGFLLLVKYFWDNRFPSKEVKNSIASNPNARMNIFGFHFLLALTEQSSLYPFLTNISSSGEATALESFSANNSNDFFLIHIFYLLGIFIGSFSLIHIICFLLEEPAYSLYLWFQKNSGKFLGDGLMKFIPSGFLNFKTVGDYVRIVHFFFQTVTLIFALSSLPYLGIEYALTNPLGFVPNDQIFHQFKQTSFLTHSTSPTYYRSRTNFVGQKFFRYDDWEEFYQKNIPLDTSLYDQGSYRLYTMEDLHYGADYEWLRRRSEKVKIRGRMKKLRWFPRAWANRFWDLAKVWSRRNVAWRNEILSQYEASWDSKGAPALNKLIREGAIRTSSSNTGQPWGTDPDWGLKFLTSGQGFWWDWSSRRIFSDNDIWWNWLNKKSNLENPNLNSVIKTLDVSESSTLSNLIKIDQEPKKQKEQNPDFWMPQERIISLYSEQTPQKIKRQFNQEISTLRKFVRKFQNRIKIQRKLDYNKISEKLSFGTNSLIRVPLKRLSLKNNKILKYKALINERLNNTTSSLMSSSLKKKEGMNTEKYSSGNIKQTRKSEGDITSFLTSKNQKDLSTAPVLLHPIQFYLHKQQGFARKLRFYGAQASRELESGNNAPAMRFYLRTYFQNYKPTRLSIKSIKMKRHLGVGAWNRVKQMIYADAKNKRSRILSRTPWIRQWVSQEGFLARRKRLEAWIKRQHYDPDELWSVIMKADIDSFIARQPSTHSFTPNEERLLHLRRFLLFEHYDSLRWYTYMQHYRTMKTRLGGTKSFTSRIYNQQFKGTFHKVRHLFALTPSASAGSVLKFDQPLYNELNNNALLSSILHEELLIDKQSNELNPIPLGPQKGLGLNQEMNLNNISSSNNEQTGSNLGNKNSNLKPQKDLIEQSLDIVREYIVRAAPIRLEIKQKLLAEKNYDELTRFLWAGQKQWGNSIKTTGSIPAFANLLKEKLLRNNEFSSNLTFDKDSNKLFDSSNFSTNSSILSILEKRQLIGFKKQTKDYKKASERLWSKWKKRFSWEEANLKVPYRVYNNNSFSNLQSTSLLFDENKNSKQNLLALAVLRTKLENKNILDNNQFKSSLLKIRKDILLTKIEGILSNTQFNNDFSNVNKQIIKDKLDLTNISTNGIVSIQKALKKAVNSYLLIKNSALIKRNDNMQESLLLKGDTASFNQLLKQRLIDSKKFFTKNDKHSRKIIIRNIINKNHKNLFLRIQNLLPWVHGRIRNNLKLKTNNFFKDSSVSIFKTNYFKSNKVIKEKDDRFVSFIKVQNLNNMTYTKNTILRNRTNLRESLLNVKNSLSTQNKKAAIRALRHQKRGMPGRRPKSLYSKKQNMKTSSSLTELLFKNFDLSELNRQKNNLYTNNLNLLKFENQNDLSIIQKSKSIFKEESASLKNNLKLLNFLNLSNLPEYFESNRIVPRLIEKEDIDSFNTTSSLMSYNKAGLSPISSNQLLNKVYDSDLFKKFNYSGIRGTGVEFKTFSDPTGITPLSQRLARAKQRRKTNMSKVKRKLLRRHLNRLSRQKWSIYASTSLQNELEQNNNGILQKLRENISKKSSILLKKIDDLENYSKFDYQENKPEKSHLILDNNNMNKIFSEQSTLKNKKSLLLKFNLPLMIFKDEQTSLFNKSNLLNKTDSLSINKEKQKIKRNLAMFLNANKSRDLISFLMKETSNENFKKYESLSESAILSSRTQLVSLLKQNKLISSQDSRFLNENSPILNSQKLLPEGSSSGTPSLVRIRKEPSPYLNTVNKTRGNLPQVTNADLSRPLQLFKLFKKRAQRSISKAKKQLLPSLISKAGDNLKRSYSGLTEDNFMLINKGNRIRRSLFLKNKTSLTEKINNIRKGLNYLNKNKKFKKVDKDRKSEVLKTMIGMTYWLQETKKSYLPIKTKDLSKLNTFNNVLNKNGESLLFNNQIGSLFIRRKEPIRSQKWILEGILRPKRITSQQAHNKRYSHLRKTPRPKRLSRLLSLNDHPLKQRLKNEKSFYEAQQSLSNLNNFAFLAEKQIYQKEVIKWLKNNKYSLINNQQEILNEKILNKLSSKQIVLRNLNESINSIDSNNQNFLQIGDRDYKPLAVPIAIQIRENIDSNTNKPNEFGQLTQKSSSFLIKDEILNNVSKNLFLTNSLKENIEQDSLFKFVLNANNPLTGFGAVTFLVKEEPKSNLLNTNPIPFYAGWDESLRKFVVTNRLLSRKEAGYTFNSINKELKNKNAVTNLKNNSLNFFATTSNLMSSEKPSLFENWPLQGRNAATTLFTHLPFMTPPSNNSLTSEGEVLKYQLSKQIVQKPSSSLKINADETGSSAQNSSNNLSEIISLQNKKKLEFERVKKNRKSGSVDRSNRKVTNLVLIDQIKNRRSALFAPLRWRSLKNNSLSYLKTRIIVKTNLSLLNSKNAIGEKEKKIHQDGLVFDLPSLNSKNSERKNLTISQKISPKSNLLRVLRKGYKAKQRLPRLRNYLTSDENSSWKWNEFISRRIRQQAYFGLFTLKKSDGQKNNSFLFFNKKLGWQKLRWVARNKRSLSRHVVGKSDSRRKQKRNNRQKIYLRPRKRPLRRRSLGVRLTRLNSVNQASISFLNQRTSESNLNSQSSLVFKQDKETSSLPLLKNKTSFSFINEPIQTINRWSVNPNVSSIQKAKIYRNFFTPPSIHLPLLYEVLPGHSRYLPSIKKRPAPGSSVTIVQRASKWQILENSSALQREALMHGWATKRLLQNMLQKNNDLQSIPIKNDINKNVSSAIDKPLNSLLLNHSEFFDKKLSLSSSLNKLNNSSLKLLNENKRRQLNRRTLKLRQLSYTLPMRLYDRWFFYYYLGGREDPLQNLFLNINKFVGQKNLNKISNENDKIEQTDLDGLFNSSLKNNMTSDSKQSANTPISFSHDINLDVVPKMFNSYFKQGNKDSGSLFNLKRDSLVKVRRFITLKSEESVSFESYLQSLKARAEIKKEKKRAVQSKSRKMTDFDSASNEQKSDQSGLINSLDNSNMWWYNFRLFKSSLNDDILKFKLNKGRTLKRDDNMQDILSFYKFDRAPVLEDFRSPISSNRHYPLNGGFVWPGDYLRLQTIKIPKERKILERKTLVLPSLKRINERSFSNKNLLLTKNDQSIQENINISVPNLKNESNGINLKIQKNYNSYTDNMLMSFSKLKNRNNVSEFLDSSNNTIEKQNETSRTLLEGSSSKTLKMTKGDQIREKVQKLKVVMGHSIFNE